MAFSLELAERVRIALIEKAHFNIQEKKMFGGLAFMVRSKMCINVSKDRLMCRFNPSLQEKVEQKAGFEPMIMKSKLLKGYCYVHREGYESIQDFNFWLELCLEYNKISNSSKKK